ncbi:hypothetical protein DDZ13_10725 [Coraliomargarita sinensis]|uniref:Outer membrane lipoprotein-sorting protein n=1 Tax=Coraliomargarita sinensis TaxID=2174842 RepID=A0A317ZIN4_9BACT|nr:hypothetical protein [Coraliomargarita sinensis]PXA03758.1 hypothetical protein DDZ13_10725 [Coraliomargarita sinensis]
MRFICIHGLVFTCLSLAFSSLSLAVEDPQLRETLNKHWEAMGGNNWLKVESIRLSGTIERNGRAADICIVKKRPNQIRATVTLPLPGGEDEKLQVIRAHDGEAAWTATRLAGAPVMKKDPLPPDAAAELLADAGVLPPLIKLWREGGKLKRSTPETKGALTLIPISSQPGNGETSHVFYLNHETHLLHAIENRTTHSVTKTTFADYTWEAGVRLAKTSKVESSETGHSKLETKSIQIGVGIYDEYFSSTGGPEAQTYTLSRPTED